uniref:Uncharacterized protein n=1 Tax=Timema monikensis TaxID=170555 RepID=A0A7R9HPU3_9NEOP|nr:unnamed protein product [Timema monikensis]
MTYPLGGSPGDQRDASRKLEEVIKADNFVLSLKHIKPRHRLRGSVETLFAVDFPSSQQKFVLMLDRRTKRAVFKIVSVQVDYNLAFDSVSSATLQFQR